MSSESIVGAPRQDTPPTQAPILPLFVCAGTKDVAYDYILLSHGANCGEPLDCPMREVCAWYAAHDLGENAFINEQADGQLLNVRFRKNPFACPDFLDYDKFMKAQKRKQPVRRKRKASPEFLEALKASTAAKANP